MEFNPEYIKDLILEANEILLQDEVDKIARKALLDCLGVVQGNKYIMESKAEPAGK